MMNYLNTTVFEMIAEHSHDLLAVLSLSGSIVYVSPSIERYGYSCSEMTGTESYKYIHDADLATFAQAISLLEHTMVQSVRYRLMAKDGRVYWVETTLKLIPDGHVISVTRDIDNHKLEEERIRTLARDLELANRRLEELVLVDPLTGIGNRRMFSTRLDSLLQEAERGRALSVIMLDVDNFKACNDKYGHSGGDEVLKLVAGTLSSTIRRIDCVARYGGEEFAVVSASRADGAKVLGEKLRLAIQCMDTPYSSITVSAGIASYVYGDTMSDIVGYADRALYAAKAAGRNRVVVAER